EDIDGTTVALLQQNDLIQIFPRIKDRVKFVDQRTKLILDFNEQQVNKDATTVDASDSASRLVQSYDQSENNDSPNSLDANENIGTNNRASTTDPDSSSHFPLNDDTDIHSNAALPEDYKGPNLTIKMNEYIEQNNISKFNPHTKMRSELLSLLFDDVTKSHQLLYPTNDEYLTMAKCLVKKLRIPPSLFHDSVKDWHESIKQKFKRERRPLQISNNLVRSKQDRYGNGKTNGRPKRKSTFLQAERRIIDIPLINLADRQNENLLVIVNQMKMELLKDDSNNDLLHDLWKQSFNIRRLCIRELEIDEILERFPGYRHSELISIIDYVLPIRIVRTLCKLFGDSVGNVFTYEEVLSPYPCMKILDDKFELYLDFHLVTETKSCSIALALLLSLYYVFEIQFGHHNRCCRLLYGVLFEDSHYLNKALKNLINSWKYKIVNRPLLRRQAAVTNLVDSLTQPSTMNEHTSSPSNIYNEIADVLPEQFDPNQYSSSHLYVTTSTNIDEENINELEEEDKPDQSSVADGDDFHQSSTTTRPVLASQSNLPMMIQSASAAPFKVQDSSFNLNSKETHQTTAPQTLILTPDCENETGHAEKHDKSYSTATRKRKITKRSSSSVSALKSSTRIQSKRIRLY
ncbi:unnamed protein product, partial [Rotaria sp. Silwood2]